jgi:hypothetical protein
MPAAKVVPAEAPSVTANTEIVVSHLDFMVSVSLTR